MTGSATQEFFASEESAEDESASASPPGPTAGFGGDGDAESWNADHEAMTPNLREADPTEHAEHAETMGAAQPAREEQSLGNEDGAGRATRDPQAVIPSDNALISADAERALAPTDLVIPPIPRISVHAFCLSENTARVIQNAKEDRRLARAQVNVDMGGAAAAVAYFSEAPTPNLVVVEMEASAETIFNQLADLADVCDPGTKVIVTGECNDIRIYRALIREGISEYLVTPFTSIQLIETIGGLYEDPEAAPLGRVTAFIGSKGGSGASTIAHNVAWTFASQFQEETTIVDLDLAYGTACLNFNQDPTAGLADALAAPERMDDVLLDRLLIDCGPNLHIFSAPSSLDRDYETSPHAFETILDTVRKNVPNVVVDVPNVWTDWSKMVLLTADQIVIVSVPDLASLRNTMNLFEVFKTARPNDPLPHLVLNKTGLAKKIEITQRDFTEALHREPSVVIPFDAELFGKASNNGQMIGEIDKRGELSAKFVQLTSLITGREARTEKKSSVLDLLSFQKIKKPKREKRSA